MHKLTAESPRSPTRLGGIATWGSDLRSRGRVFHFRWGRWVDIK